MGIGECRKKDEYLARVSYSSDKFRLSEYPLLLEFYQRVRMERFAGGRSPVFVPRMSCTGQGEVRTVGILELLLCTAVVLILSALVEVGSVHAWHQQVPTTPQNSDGYIETVDGVQLFYRTKGVGLDTVVVLHGGPGLNLDYLAPDLKPLEESRTIIYYDQRGAGRSTVLSDASSLHIDAHISDLEAVRTYFGIDRLTLLGHSWGAMLAARYAREHPGRVSRVIKVSPGPIRIDPYDSQFFPRVTAWMDSTTVAEVQALQERYQQADNDVDTACRNFFDLFKRGYFYDPTDLEAFQRLRGDFCTAPEPAIRNFWTVNALTLQSVGEFDWREDFRDLTLPVLVITGVSDVFPPQNYREWEAAFPDADLILLEGAGHYPHVEQPEAFFGAVDAFLRE